MTDKTLRCIARADAADCHEYLFAVGADGAYLILRDGQAMLDRRWPAAERVVACESFLELCLGRPLACRPVAA